MRLPSLPFRTLAAGNSPLLQFYKSLLRGYSMIAEAVHLLPGEPSAGASCVGH